jgi:hypothetical protein
MIERLNSYRVAVSFSMFETILILAFSSALFAYWFRYTVLLLLHQEGDSKTGPLLDQLGLSQTRQALQDHGQNLPLERVREAIEKDYRLLLYLLDHAMELGLQPLEQYLLILDYRLMSLWFRLTRHASVKQSRRALDEMSEVLACIACKMGARNVAASHA